MTNKTAALIIIGNEILSGRTQDLNLNFIAKKLCERGIDFIESRVIKDDHQSIKNIILELKDKVDYLFTTGGIGPTHDDITSESIAKALQLKLEINIAAKESLENFYHSRNDKLTESRLKMAIMPEGCKLIENPITFAPGYIIQNIYVLPGVPSIMQAMFSELVTQFPQGKIVKSKTLEIDLPESKIAEQFAKLQTEYPRVEMGSYPKQINDEFHTSLVLRSSNEQLLEKAFNKLQQIFS